MSTYMYTDMNNEYSNIKARISSRSLDTTLERNSMASFYPGEIALLSQKTLNKSVTQTENECFDKAPVPRHYYCRNN